MQWTETHKYHPVHGKSHSIQPREYSCSNTDSLCWSRHLFLPNRLSLLLAEGDSAWELNLDVPGWETWSFSTASLDCGLLDKFGMIFLNIYKSTFSLIQPDLKKNKNKKAQINLKRHFELTISFLMLQCLI